MAGPRFATIRSTGGDRNSDNRFRSSRKIVSLADPNAGGLTWDQAAKKLATGQCAFLSMNDSVYGELVANQAVEGKDFGYVPYPGTDGRIPGDRRHVRGVGGTPQTA